MSNAYRSRASSPDPEVEKLSAGSGPVKSSFMSPEELEDYRARTGYKGPKENVAPKSSGIELQPNPKSKAAVDKEEALKQDFLKYIAEGQSIAATERLMGLKLNTLPYRVKKWGLTGINHQKAKELLGTAEDHEVQNASLVDYEKKLAEWDLLEKELEKYKSDNKELEDQINVYGDEIARWVVVDNEKSVLLSEMSEDRDNWRQTAEQAKQAILELEEERSVLVETIEKATLSESLYSPPHHLLREENDNVNHPAHYTAGGIECIDAIDAALTGVSGGHAYATGAAIKYLWRWQRKNGVEDLRKAVWYINRMIETLGCDHDAGSVLSRNSVGNHR